MSRPILITVSTVIALVLLLMVGRCANAECLPSAEAVWKVNPTSWAVQRHDGCWHKGGKYVAGAHHKHAAGKGMVRGKPKTTAPKVEVAAASVAPVPESVSFAIINCAADLDSIHACFAAWERRQSDVVSQTR